MATTASAPHPMGTRIQLPEEPKKFRPVLLWAALGGGFLAFAIYLWTRWIFSGEFKTTPTGQTHVPTYMHVFLRVHEIAGPFILAFFAYWFIIRPLRREGHLSWDGMF